MNFPRRPVGAVGKQTKRPTTKRKTNMKNKLILTALVAIASLGIIGCASTQHSAKSCDGSCCKQGAEACAKCCGKDCAACCGK